MHLVRGMVGIRVYVHNAIPLYPDYTPFTRKGVTLLSAKFERLDGLESRFQADLDNICETFNVERRSRKFEKWRTTP